MLGNWIQQTTTTTGTGNLTLSSVSGLPGFYDLFSTTGYFVYEILDDATGAPLEAGIGHMIDAVTMVRDRVTATYSGSVYDDTSPATISLAAGTKRVICALEEGSASPTIPNVQNAFGQRIVLPDGQLPAGGTKALAANQMLLTCLRWNCGREIASLACQITTANGTGSDHIQLGVYACDHNGLPGPLLCRTGDILPNSTGYKTSSLAGGNIRLPPGWYWFAILSNVTPTVVANNAGSSDKVSISTPMGGPTGAVNGRYGFFTAAIGAGWTNMPASVTLGAAVSVASDFMPTIGAVLP
ncbi:MAG TPA: hypothetical protein VK165_09410 [Azonexus sp.]|nr:hypothetical protein [Azonexus sp.]